MNAKWLFGAAMLGTVLLSSASGEAAMVSITMTTDDAEIAVGEVTTLHIFAEITEGAVTDNGIFAYALNVLGDAPGIFAVDSVIQLGDPNPLFSDPGTILSNGLHDVYGGDGGFFTDMNRGIGEPFELLTIDLIGQSPGLVAFSAGLADSADFLGIPDGILLQHPGTVDVAFDAGVSITVVPEPSSILMLALLAPLLRNRNSRNSIVGEAGPA